MFCKKRELGVLAGWLASETGTRVRYKRVTDAITFLLKRYGVRYNVP